MVVELHSILLTISPFMFWEDPKTLPESILSLLFSLAKNGLQDYFVQYVNVKAFCLAFC